ncbi:MAG: putative chaperone protein HscA/DnaK [Polaromonas sp.]|nr:putative chaperone protein HscA/DnaK [Polaromonas sp.]
MSQYIVGIDLGTTHTVVAYAPLATPAGGPPAPAPAAIELFEIAQLVAPGEVDALPLLASCRYQAAPGELAAAALTLPWPETQPAEASDTADEADEADGAAPGPIVIGQWARKLGAQVPGRLVASAKSWLSHAAVDRLAPILPWGAPADVPKVSPVEASASYLRHVRQAWNARFPGSPLERQQLVLTVPASFDEGARALTLRAARLAGLPELRLLEEPQAAFYDWLLRHRGDLAGALAQTRLVLVCDVGGGTTDLSLIQVDLAGGLPRLTRIGVGNHLMLGGDNMDLALAHAVEARMPSSAGAAAAAPLSASRLAQLMERCRAAKELLLAADAPDETPVTLLGSGARLVGGSRSVMLARQEVEHLIVDGFFPPVGADAQVRQARSGIVAFGLPYARDPAITRHVADFLRQHGHAMPDTLLLNGGVFRGHALARRLADTLAAWRGAPLRLLHNDNPDVAVARGAVAYALAQQGLAPRIGGGSARSYFLRLDGANNAVTRRGICILPRGTELGQELLLTGRTFALRLGQPVRFHLLASVSSGVEQAAPQLGELVALSDDRVVQLPPIVTVLQAAPDAEQAAENPAPPPAGARRDITVQLATSLTEVGTLELHCVSLADPTRRWLLAFDLRHGGDSAAAPDSPGGEASVPASRLSEALQKIDRIFGATGQAVAPRDVRQLRAQLEQVLGERERWDTPALRQLFDALWQRARGRRRSAEHERVWLNLAGYCLRPGFGDALDSWRMQQLWPLLETGVQHARDKQVCAEWWTLWRRVAGGLDDAQQLRLLDDFAFNLQGDKTLLNAGGSPPVGGSELDMLRLGASLERIPAGYKAEIGNWLLTRLQAAPAAKPGRRAAVGDTAMESVALWALGRIGARQPFHGSPHDVVAPETADAWLDTLLAFDWKRVEAAAFAAVSLCRVTDDRARDLPLARREQVMARLRTSHAPASWIEMVRHKVELDEAVERRVLGESLPPGLKLIA